MEEAEYWEQRARYFKRNRYVSAFQVLTAISTIGMLTYTQITCRRVIEKQSVAITQLERTLDTQQRLVEEQKAAIRRQSAVNGALLSQCRPNRL